MTLTNRDFLLWHVSRGMPSIAIVAVIWAALLATSSRTVAENTNLNLLKAPFDAAAAKNKQREWTTHLKREIEEKNSIGMKLQLIPPGEFMMGSPESEIGFWKLHKEDELQHRVRITRPFYLGIYPVRVRDFRQFVEVENYRTDAENDRKGGWGWTVIGKSFQQDPRFNWRDPGFKQGDDHPVVNMSWNDAVAFCRWLSKKEGKRYRLPTEAEWEYACRAGTTAPFSFGDSCNGTQANCNGNLPYGTPTKGPYLYRTCDAGSYAPNAFGLYDMHGNASQWCSDWYDKDYYKNSTTDDPPGASSGTRRTARGGAWYSHSVLCRSANRGGGEPADRGFDRGFRVVREP